MGRRTFLLPGDLLDVESLAMMLDVIRKHIAYPNLFSNLHVNFQTWTDEEATNIKNIIDKVDGIERLEEELSIQFKWNIEEPNKTINIEGEPLTIQ